MCIKSSNGLFTDSVDLLIKPNKRQFVKNREIIIFVKVSWKLNKIIKMLVKISERFVLKNKNKNYTNKNSKYLFMLNIWQFWSLNKTFIFNFCKTSTNQIKFQNVSKKNAQHKNNLNYIWPISPPTNNSF